MENNQTIDELSQQIEKQDVRDHLVIVQYFNTNYRSMQAVYEHVQAIRKAMSHLKILYMPISGRDVVTHVEVFNGETMDAELLAQLKETLNTMLEKFEEEQKARAEEEFERQQIEFHSRENELTTESTNEQECEKYYEGKKSLLCGFVEWLRQRWYGNV